MKSLLFALWAILVSTSALRAEAPAISAESAVKLAQEQLTSRNLQGKHYISSLKLEKGSITSKQVRWVAMYTPSIPLGDRKELGVEIGMDGSVVRLVNKEAKK